MTDKELLKQSLNALEGADQIDIDMRDAIVALKARLKQAEKQKPVAWMMTNAVGKPYFRKKPQDKVFNPQPVYTAPLAREWVGLTAKDYDSMRSRVPYIVNDFSFADVAAIVEAKLKEKNT